MCAQEYAFYEEMAIYHRNFNVAYEPENVHKRTVKEA